MKIKVRLRPGRSSEKFDIVEQNVSVKLWAAAVWRNPGRHPDPPWVPPRWATTARSSPVCTQQQTTINKNFKKSEMKTEQEKDSDKLQKKTFSSASQHSASNFSWVKVKSLLQLVVFP